MQRKGVGAAASNEHALIHEQYVCTQTGTSGRATAQFAGNLQRKTGTSVFAECTFANVPNTFKTLERGARVMISYQCFYRHTDKYVHTGLSSGPPMTSATFAVDQQNAGIASWTQASPPQGTNIVSRFPKLVYPAQTVALTERAYTIPDGYYTQGTVIEWLRASVKDYSTVELPKIMRAQFALGEEQQPNAVFDSWVSHTPLEPLQYLFSDECTVFSFAANGHLQWECRPNATFVALWNAWRVQLPTGGTVAGAASVAPDGDMEFFPHRLEFSLRVDAGSTTPAEAARVALFLGMQSGANMTHVFSDIFRCPSTFSRFPGTYTAPLWHPNGAAFLQDIQKYTLHAVSPVAAVHIRTQNVFVVLPAFNSQISINGMPRGIVKIIAVPGTFGTLATAAPAATTSTLRLYSGTAANFQNLAVEFYDDNFEEISTFITPWVVQLRFGLYDFV